VPQVLQIPPKGPFIVILLSSLYILVTASTSGFQFHFGKGTRPERQVQTRDTEYNYIFTLFGLNRKSY
jgi:hypothetical protein